MEIKIQNNIGAQELIGNSSKINTKPTKTLIDLHDKKDIAKSLNI